MLTRFLRLIWIPNQSLYPKILATSHVHPRILDSPNSHRWTDKYFLGYTLTPKNKNKTNYKFLSTSFTPEYILHFFVGTLFQFFFFLYIHYQYLIVPKSYKDIFLKIFLLFISVYSLTFIILLDLIKLSLSLFNVVGSSKYFKKWSNQQMDYF